MKNKSIALVLLITIFWSFFSNTVFSSNLEWNLNTWNINWNSWINACVLPSSSSLNSPEWLVASPTSTTSIKLTWNFNISNDNFSKYELYRSDDSSFSTNTIKVYEWTNTEYLWTDLNNNKKYYYKVRSLYNYNNCNNTTLYSKFSPVTITETLKETINLDNSNDSSTQTTVLWNNWFNINLNNTLTIEMANTVLFDDSSFSGTINDFSWVAIWDTSIDLPDTNWILNVTTILKSINTIKDDNNNELDSQLYIPSWTEFNKSNWDNYTWEIIPPTIIWESEASALKSENDIISVIEVWSKTESINLWTTATLLIPVPGYNTWENLDVKYSIDWTTWNNQNTYTVINIDNKPYIKVETTHFTKFAVVKSLSDCNESQLDISYWTCSCSWTKTSTNYIVNTNFIWICKSPNNWNYSTSCTIPSSCTTSSSSWWWGGGWSYSPICQDKWLTCRSVAWSTSLYKWYKKDWFSCTWWNIWKVCSLEKNPKIINNNPIIKKKNTKINKDISVYISKYDKKILSSKTGKIIYKTNNKKTWKILNKLEPIILKKLNKLYESKTISTFMYDKAIKDYNSLVLTYTIYKETNNKKVAKILIKSIKSLLIIYKLKVKKTVILNNQTTIKKEETITHEEKKPRLCSIKWYNYIRPKNAHCVTNDPNSAWKCDNWYIERWYICVKN